MRLEPTSMKSLWLSFIAATACLTVLALASCGRQTNGDVKARGDIAESAESRSAIIDPGLVTSELRKGLTDFVCDALIYGTGHQVSALYPFSMPIRSDEGLFNFDQLHKIGGYPCLSTLPIDQLMASEGMRAILKGTGKSGPVANCFNPRHAISTTYGGKTIDFVICHQCGHVYIHVDDEFVVATRDCQELKDFTDRVHREMGLIAFADDLIKREVWSRDDAPYSVKVDYHIAQTLGTVFRGIGERIEYIFEDAALPYAKGNVVVYRLAVNPNDQPSSSLLSGHATSVFGRKVIDVVPLVRSSSNPLEGTEWPLMSKIIGVFGTSHGLRSLFWYQQDDSYKLESPDYSIQFGDTADRWMLLVDSVAKRAQLLRPDGGLDKEFDVTSAVIAALVSTFQQKKK